MLPVALHLFDGLGRKHSLVKKCQDALDKIKGAKSSFRDEYIKKIFDDDTVADAFVNNYSLLDKNSIEILVTAYDYGL